MSSLDQAFIKAYQGHGGRLAGVPAEMAKTVPLAHAFSEPPTSQATSEPAIVPLDTLLGTLSAEPRISPQNAPLSPTPRRDETHDISAGTALPELGGRGPAGNDRGASARCKARRPTALLRIWPEERQPVGAEEQPRPRRVPQLNDLDLPDVVPLPGLRPAEDEKPSSADKAANLPTIAVGESSAKAARQRAPCSAAQPQGATDTVDSSRANWPTELPAQAKGEVAGRCSTSEGASRVTLETATLPATSKPGGPESPSGGSGMQPLLQVDYFHWPRLCRRLAGMAGEELERLARWLEQRTVQGRRVIAFGAYQRGEGATSLLLAAARRLAACGLRVVLVDADFARPQLAARLGLVPQVGWEAVLAGRAALAEAMVESIEDRLVLLPVREAFAGAGLPLGHEAAVGRSLEQLAAAVDLVLVDVGPLKERAVAEGLLLRAMGPVLDALVLVENVAAAAKARRAEVQQRLAAAGVPLAGVVENLVRRA